MAETIVNKVSSSGLVTINLEDLLPAPPVVFDLKDHLFMGLILKEKEFRQALKETDWSVYKEKEVAITCTADAIIPVWAYMLVTTYLQPVAKYVSVGTAEDVQRQLFLKNINALNADEFKDQRVVIKGCGDKEVGNFAYAEITRLLVPHVRSIMYGEPCSTVPVYKRK
ncbi:MAG: DUF2480 family protein [Flavisolibacter sp.]